VGSIFRRFGHGGKDPRRWDRVYWIPRNTIGFSKESRISGFKSGSLGANTVVCLRSWWAWYTCELRFAGLYTYGYYRTIVPRPPVEPGKTPAHLIATMGAARRCGERCGLSL